jgi:Immunoglobulin-like domain of bacterial spore germination
MVSDYGNTADADLERRVRDALRHEADAIEPSGAGLGAIQARTARGAAAGRARTRWLAGGAAALATAAAVAAITVLGTSDLGLAPGPAPQPAGPAGPAVGAPPLAVFYLDSTPERIGEPGSVRVDDPGLYQELRPAPAQGDRVESAVRELAGSTPADPDYANPWHGVTVHQVRFDSADAVVDVSALPPEGPSREAGLQALAHTVWSAAGTRAPVEVTVEVDGEAVRTVSAADPVGTFAGIWVLSPEQGAELGAPVGFSGMAATFEGNVAYEIRHGGPLGQVVASGATIARGGMGTWSQWSFTRRLEPGAYTLVAFDEDPALGGRRDVDTKDFTVR